MAMKLQKFTSYENYVERQVADNKRKLSHVWVTRKELDIVADLVEKREVAGDSKVSGICHGVRNGFEVEVLRERLGAGVFGTEISDTADQFANVIQWDFHELKPEWLGAMDFIYSNSWDHSYAPDVLFQRWASCLAPGGLMILEWSRNHMPKSVYHSDWFGIDLDDFLVMLRKEHTVDRVISFNKLTLCQGLRKPLAWLKGQVAPVRLVVVSSPQSRGTASS